MLITVSVGGEWARHPIEPTETDIINGLANILINLINGKQRSLFSWLAKASYYN